MFQEYINNVISSRESTRRFVMITLRAKMRFYVFATMQISQQAAANDSRLVPFRRTALSRTLMIRVLLRFTKIYYIAVLTRVLSTT